MQLKIWHFTAFFVVVQVLLANNKIFSFNSSQKFLINIDQHLSGKWIFMVTSWCASWQLSHISAQNDRWQCQELIDICLCLNSTRWWLSRKRLISFHFSASKKFSNVAKFIQKVSIEWNKIKIYQYCVMLVEEETTKNNLKTVSSD